MEALFADVQTEAMNPVQEPDWRLPADLLVIEAEQLTRDDTEHHLDIDQTVAVALLKLELDKLERAGFARSNRWYQPTKREVFPPAQTCHGMVEAGAALAQAIDDGETIAVYCDYDVDGTTAGEVLRRGLESYGPNFHYGYADAQQGFGLTNDFVEQAAAAGAQTLVTLDCGTGQASQVKLAQSLGMKVVVVDHHNIADNPAEYHLNPKVPPPEDSEERWPTSDNTGSQLAWKLAASVQQAKEGRTRDDLWEEPMHLAGMGYLADMGSVMLPENRAFSWVAHEHPVPGVRALAKALGEDPTVPGQTVTTQAALNLPKRTANVSAADVGALLAAPTEEAAAPMVEKLLLQYEAAKPVRKQMVAHALEQTGEAITDEDGKVTRPGEGIVASAVMDERFGEYAGYTGPVAQNVSRATAKPAIVFAPRGVDEHGQEVYKFSSRNASRAALTLGGLIEDEAMREACTLKKRDEAGEVVEEPNVGGHAAVVSGACTKENLPKVLAAVEAYAQGVRKDTRSFWPTPWDGPEAFPLERKVSAKRLARIEREAQRLGPFTREKQQMYPTATGKEHVKGKTSEPQLTVEGTLTLAGPDPVNEKWLVGALALGDNIVREVRYPADQPAPTGRRCEWLLRVGRPGAYWLRTYHDPNPPAA